MPADKPCWKRSISITFSLVSRGCRQHEPKWSKSLVIRAVLYTVSRSPTKVESFYIGAIIKLINSCQISWVDWRWQSNCIYGQSFIHSLIRNLVKSLYRFLAHGWITFRTQEKRKKNMARLMATTTGPLQKVVTGVNLQLLWFQINRNEIQLTGKFNNLLWRLNIVAAYINMPDSILRL